MVDVFAGLGIFVGLFLLLCAGGLVAFIFWLWMLIDCAMKEPSIGNDKLIWILIIILLPLVGSVVYFFVRRPERITQHGK